MTNSRPISTSSHHLRRLFDEVCLFSSKQRLLHAHVVFDKTYVSYTSDESGKKEPVSFFYSTLAFFQRFRGCLGFPERGQKKTFEADCYFFGRSYVLGGLCKKNKKRVSTEKRRRLQNRALPQNGCTRRVPGKKRVP